MTWREEQTQTSSLDLELERIHQREWRILNLTIKFNVKKLRKKGNLLEGLSLLLLHSSQEHSSIPFSQLLLAICNDFLIPHCFPS